MKKLITVSILIISISTTSQIGSAQNDKAPCTPNLAVAKLLDGLRISDRGYLSIGEIYAYCLPKPVRESSSNYPYDPDDGGKLSTVLKKADGTVLNTFVWYAENVSTIWVMSSYKTVGGNKALKPLEPGNYQLEFAVEDKPFYRFNFSVSKMPNGDIYNPGDIYLLDGLWNDYAAFYYLKPDRYTQLDIWLRDKGKPSKKITQYEMKLTRESDGKVIAEGGGESSAMQLQPYWNHFNLSFRPPKEVTAQTNSYEFKAQEVLKTDGKYTISLSVDGKPYGEYSFTVKDGRIQSREPRDKTDPLSKFEDGNNTWWLKRK